MKIFTSTFLLLFTALCLPAQNLSYEFSTFTRPYEEISGSISVDNGEPWDDPDYEIPIGFKFNYFGEDYGTLFMDEWSGGFLTFGDSTPYAILGAYTSDINVRSDDGMTSASSLSYNLEGNAGSRIFKLQWKNVGFWNSVNEGNLNDSINFQLWLYEADNSIEVTFGEYFIEDDEIAHDDYPGPTVVLTESYFFDDFEEYWVNTMYLNGDAMSPDFVEFGNDPFLNGNPEPGRVYRFGPASSGVGQELLPKSTFQISPNPAEAFLYLKNLENQKIESFSIYNQTGILIKKIPSSEGLISEKIDLDGFTKGIYFIRIDTENGIWREKFIKI